jgi:hypothetical protein
MIVPGPLLDRLEARTRRDENGCLLWTGTLTPNGYGQFQLRRGRFGLAHRLMWEEKVGPIPEGMQLDHLCRVRACVEISHLEPVTQKVNSLRGQAPAILRHHEGVCVRGHQFEPGTRCKECIREIEREGYQYLRAQGYSPEEARRKRNTTEVRRALGYADMRFVGAKEG